jgi:hypothetical protein
MAGGIVGDDSDDLVRKLLKARYPAQTTNNRFPRIPVRVVS